MAVSMPTRKSMLLGGAVIVTTIVGIVVVTAAGSPSDPRDEDKLASVLEHAARAQQRYASRNNDRYTQNVDTLLSYGLDVPDGIEVAVPYTNNTRRHFATTYCIQAREISSGRTMHYDNIRQRARAGACLNFWHGDLDS